MFKATASAEMLKNVEMDARLKGGWRREGGECSRWSRVLLIRRSLISGKLDARSTDHITPGDVSKISLRPGVFPWRAPPRKGSEREQSEISSPRSSRSLVFAIFRSQRQICECLKLMWFKNLWYSFWNIWIYYEPEEVGRHTADVTVTIPKKMKYLKNHYQK